MKQHYGIIAAVASAFIFGFTAILSKLSYEGGSNGITLTFLRAAFAIPVLFAVLKIRRVPVAISKKELRDVLMVGIPGPALTTLLLYGSYHYISVGIATTLHFMYPVMVTLAGLVFFKDTAGKPKPLALALGFSGVLLFFENNSAVGIVGILLAFSSSLTYTIYMLGVEKTSLRHINHFKLSLYFCVLSLVMSGLFGAATGTLTFQLATSAWAYSFLVSILVAVGGITLLQWGITLIGASTTAILSTLEPITSVLLGALILSERLSLLKLSGCILILASVFIVTRTKNTGKNKR